MNILTQILSLSTTNLLTNTISGQFKEKLHSLLEVFLYNKDDNRYVNMMISLQEFMNSSIVNFLVHYIASIDKQFKDSKERKQKYYINKSNVERTIVSIFGSITYKRTLYIDKITGEYYNYTDEILGIEPYKTYDAVIRGILVDDSVNTCPNNASYHNSLNALDLKSYLENSILKIPRQTIYRFKQETKIKNINYEEIPVNKTLYLMIDEKWIHKQDKNNPNKKKWIMSKCFVTFTGVKRKGKRTRLKGRHVFITSSDKPWEEFMDEIYKIYNFEEIETINLLSDAGSWILAGKDELHIYEGIKVIVNTCEFHVKLKIFRSTTDKELRKKISDIIYETEDKQKFIEEMDKLIESKTKESRKEKITEYKNYILRHWKGIINMKHSICKSSMEAHIEHCIASAFSSVPKAYSEKNIENYLKLQEAKLNGINILEYYLDTYNKPNDYIFESEKEVDYSLFDKQSTSNLPTCCSSNPVSIGLHNIAHNTFF